MTDEEQATLPRRRVEVERAGEFVECSMGDLAIGDRFRMFEADGTPDESGVWVTVGLPQRVATNAWSVVAERDL